MVVFCTSILIQNVFEKNAFCHSLGFCIGTRSILMTPPSEIFYRLQNPKNKFFTQVLYPVQNSRSSVTHIISLHICSLFIYIRDRIHKSHKIKLKFIYDARSGVRSFRILNRLIFFFNLTVVVRNSLI